MTDRGLLEAAAKAAGIDGRRLPHAWPNRFDDDQWNPLIDDGDALRLAAALGIDIEFEPKVVFADGNFSEFKAENPDAATRRAIVRAAAAMSATA